jgi:hypothetical protein
MIALRKLRQMESLPALAFSDALFLAADDHCRDASKNGLTSSIGSKDQSGMNSSPYSRVARYADARGVAESMTFGQDKATEVVLQMLIDASKREKIFDKGYCKAAVSTCKGKDFDLAVTNYADSVNLNQDGKDKISKVTNDAKDKLSKGIDIDMSKIENYNKLLVKYMEQQELARL